MNIHPLLVHFPIALLTVYCLMELIRWKKISNQPYWFYTKAIFVMLGGLGALAALLTGDMAKNAVSSGVFHTSVPNFRQVVSVHENFADATVTIFGILAASYLITWVAKDFTMFTQKFQNNTVWKLLIKLSQLFTQTRFVILLAFAGLICITITGGLGGVMVFGPNADPVFGMFYKLFFK